MYMYKYVRIKCIVQGFFSEDNGMPLTCGGMRKRDPST